MPEPGRENATRPMPETVDPPRTILNLTLVPLGNGFDVSTKHPNMEMSLR